MQIVLKNNFWDNKKNSLVEFKTDNWSIKKMWELILRTMKKELLEAVTL